MRKMIGKRSMMGVELKKGVGWKEKMMTKPTKQPFNYNFRLI